MFENVGSKIKVLAKFFCWVGIIFSLILGIVAMCTSDGYAGLVFLGLFLIIIGSLGAWLGSLFTYGFGELIEKTTKIAENTTNLNFSNEGVDDNQG